MVGSKTLTEEQLREYFQNPNSIPKELLRYVETEFKKRVEKDREKANEFRSKMMRERNRNLLYITSYNFGSSGV